MKKGVFILGSIFAIILAFMFDKQILTSIVNNRVEFLNSFIILITYIGSFYGILFIGMLLYLYDRKWNNLAIYIAVLLGALSIGLAIKYTILRARPDPETFMVFSNLIKNTPSFPSTHAIATFSVYSVVQKYYPKLAEIWLPFGVLVLFSRLYLGLHYPSDIVFGALLGYFIGAFVLGKFGNKLEKGLF